MAFWSPLSAPSSEWVTATSRKGKSEDGLGSVERPPLYISIGPQCSGKTTVLSEIPNLLDVAFDDQPFTYERVPLARFLRSVGMNAPPSFDISVMPPQEARRNIFRERLDHRLLAAVEDNEWMEIVRLFYRPRAGTWNAPGNSAQGVDCPRFDSFMDNCRSYLGEEEVFTADSEMSEGGNRSCQFLEDIFESAVREVHASGARLTTSTYDLFIPESRGMSVRQAEEKLMDASVTHSGPLAWGNTNLQCNSVQVALRIGYESRRPIKFVCWGEQLPTLSLKDLLVRNICRFLVSGRYIPTTVLARYHLQACTLVDNLKHHGVYSTNPLVAQEVDGNNCGDSEDHANHVSGENNAGSGVAVRGGVHGAGANKDPEDDDSCKSDLSDGDNDTDDDVSAENISIFLSRSAAVMQAPRPGKRAAQPEPQHLCEGQSQPLPPREASFDQIVAAACSYRMDAAGFVHPLLQLKPHRQRNRQGERGHGDSGRGQARGGTRGRSRGRRGGRGGAIGRY